MRWKLLSHYHSPLGGRKALKPLSECTRRTLAAAPRSGLISAIKVTTPSCLRCGSMTSDCCALAQLHIVDREHKGRRET